jgi:hypothetical protein
MLDRGNNGWNRLDIRPVFLQKTTPQTISPFTYAGPMHAKTNLFFFSVFSPSSLPLPNLRWTHEDRKQYSLSLLDFCSFLTFCSSKRKSNNTRRLLVIHSAKYRAMQ